MLNCTEHKSHLLHRRGVRAGQGWWRQLAAITCGPGVDTQRHIMPMPLLPAAFATLFIFFIVIASAVAAKTVARARDGPLLF